MLQLQPHTFTHMHTHSQQVQACIDRRLQDKDNIPGQEVRQSTVIPANRPVVIVKNQRSIVGFWDWESARHVATFEQYVKRITTCTRMTNMSSIKSKCSLDLKSHFRNHWWCRQSSTCSLDAHQQVESSETVVFQMCLLNWIWGKGHITHIQMSERLSV